MSDEAVRLMDRTILGHINAMVGESDTLWILGDFAFGLKNQYMERCRVYRSSIKCKNVNIVWGNHDRFEIKPLFARHFDQVMIPVPGKKFRIIMNHYAMAVWEGSHKGNIQLYGHSHGNAEENLDKMMPNRRSMDVGVDNAARIFGEYRPFRLEEILTLMDAKSGCAIDYHGSQNYQAGVDEL
jgi:calcineurin-like phosphoesterase family protein